MRRLHKKFLLFPTRNGTRLCSYFISREVQTITAKVRRPAQGPVKPHTLRISCGAYYFFKTHNERLVQVMMGYASMVTVFKYHAVDYEYFKKIWERHHPRSHFNTSATKDIF